MAPKIADWLNEFNGAVVLATMVEGELVPIITGTINAVKEFDAGNSIQYSVVLTTGKDNLDDSTGNFNAALTLVNEERAKAGKPPLTGMSTVPVK